MLVHFTQKCKDIKICTKLLAHPAITGELM